MFHEQNFKRVFPKQQNAKLLSSSMQPFNLFKQLTWRWRRTDFRCNSRQESINEMQKYWPWLHTIHNACRRGTQPTSRSSYNACILSCRPSCLLANDGTVPRAPAQCQYHNTDSMRQAKWVLSDVHNAVQCGIMAVICHAVRRWSLRLSALMDSDLAWVNGKSAR